MWFEVSQLLTADIVCSHSFVITLATSHAEGRLLCRLFIFTYQECLQNSNSIRHLAVELCLLGGFNYNRFCSRYRESLR